MPESFAPWWQYFDYCFSHNPSAGICVPFWRWSIGTVVCIGVVVLIATAWKYYRYRRAYQAAVLAEWERSQVDEVGIKENMWDGDKAYQSHVPQEEVLARIRQAVEQKKASAPAHPPPGRP